jgi:hypothetical protein
MGNAHRAVSGAEYCGHRRADRRHRYLRCVDQPRLSGRRADCAPLGHADCHAASHFHAHLYARDVADGHDHAHANPHANTNSHLDPIAHAHTVVDGNANAYRHRRADSDVAAYHHAHSSASNQHTNVAPVTVGDPDQDSSNQYPDFNLVTVTDTDTSAAHFHADTSLYAYAATDGYSDANSHFHTIANIQAVAHSNQVTQETGCSDGYGAAQSFTDSHPVCHDDQHAKAIANCNLYADGGP